MPDNKVQGTYCPLCGTMGLLRGRRGEELVHYCPGLTGDLTPKTTHTLHVVGKVEKTESRKGDS